MKIAFQGILSEKGKGLAMKRIREPSALNL